MKQLLTAIILLIVVGAKAEHPKSDTQTRPTTDTIKVVMLISNNTVLDTRLRLYYGGYEVRDIKYAKVNVNTAHNYQLPSGGWTMVDIPPVWVDRPIYTHKEYLDQYKRLFADNDDVLIWLSKPVND